jgi:putative transposase
MEHIDTRKVASEYRLSQWAQMMQARQDSGKSINDFCQEVGVSRNAYFYWQRRLRKAACKELAAAENTVDPVPNGWMQLAPKQVQKMKASLDIEVSGCHITVNAETDPGLLKKVCSMLRSL